MRQAPVGGIKPSYPSQPKQSRELGLDIVLAEDSVLRPPSSVLQLSTSDAPPFFTLLGRRILLTNTMSNPNALLLLADHIKLSLLEQQRAKTLKLSRDSQDGHISRSLDQFREGLEALEKEQQRLQEAGDESYVAPLRSQHQ